MQMAKVHRCIIVVPPKGEYLTYYYAHVIREMALKGYIQSLYRGIRERSSDFNYVTFGNCLLPVPTPSEQRQIVAYLDYKPNKINERICQRESYKLYLN